MKRLMVMQIIAVMAFYGAAPAMGVVIYDNGGPDMDDSFLSDFDPLPAFGGATEQAADEFVLLPGRSTITDVHWWGTYTADDNIPDVPDDFTIRIFGDGGGAPTVNPIHEFAVGDTGRNDTGLDASPDGDDLYEYWAFIPATTLTPGDIYWLSIVNNTPGDDDGWFWANSSQRTGDNSWFRGGDGVAWIPSTAFDKDLAFNLTGPAVPEPITAALGLMGLGVLGMATRRRVA